MTKELVNLFTILRIIILVHSLALLVYKLRVSVYSVSRSIHYRTQKDSIPESLTFPRHSKIRTL